MSLKMVHSNFDTVIERITLSPESRDSFHNCLLHDNAVSSADDDNYYYYYEL